ncbi:MAG TPA: glycosyltransferase family 4 protein [Bryobacteraceae bacterium]|nr:glycosyltransferase family 4 protein [Bryobacteraceae bacterium]
MKLLWVKADFLHPTTRGGQIRTLETLKHLSKRHEIHYVALANGDPEGVARSSEYCARAYPIEHQVPEKTSAAFAGQLVKGLVQALPVAVSRYRSMEMKRRIADLSRREQFDCTVCDFLFPAPNLPDLSSCVLFEHNVEAMIWRRHVENAPTLAHRLYYELQARRMFEYERRVCRSARSVIAVSDVDAETIRTQYGAPRVSSVSTGVDLDYFARPGDVERGTDLIFVGSMDWLPNIDGATWFVREVLPLIRKRRPECTVALAGRKPTAELLALAKSDPGIRVTGTVPDIRPFLWGSTVSIVPLRIGGGTRLKIFEAMAARVPVVSTTIGAEGLPVENGAQIHIADEAGGFADRCLELMDDASARERLSSAAWELVSARFSWDAVAREFERLLLV